MTSVNSTENSSFVVKYDSRLWIHVPQIKDRVKWSARYLRLARDIASWSRDPSRKIGAIAIGQHGQILAQGYNGFSRGIADTAERLHNREEKYKFTVHAEMNVIYNACLNGVSLNGADLYVYGLPVCSECAKGIIQVGIKRVIMTFDETIQDTWCESFKLTQKMFSESGIVYEVIADGIDE